MIVTIPVSVGELIDKITILELKARHIGEGEQRAIVARQLALLEEVRRSGGIAGAALDHLTGKLAAVNEVLWEFEEEIRACERRGDFDARFVEVARAIYRSNDQRAALKRSIDALFGSTLREVKSYKPY